MLIFLCIHIYFSYYLEYLQSIECRSSKKEWSTFELEIQPIYYVINMEVLAPITSMEL